MQAIVRFAQIVLGQHREHRIHSAIGIVETEIPYALVASLCGLTEIEAYVESMIIRQSVIVRLAVIWLTIKYMCRHCAPVSCVTVPGQVHVEFLAETVGCIDGDLMPVVVSGRIPVMPYAFEESFCP